MRRSRRGDDGVIRFVPHGVAMAKGRDKTFPRHLYGCQPSGHDIQRAGTLACMQHVFHLWRDTETMRIPERSQVPDQPPAFGQWQGGPYIGRLFAQPVKHGLPWLVGTGRQRMTHAA